jgi:hypothetical protein
MTARASYANDRFIRRILFHLELGRFLGTRLVPDRKESQVTREDGRDGEAHPVVRHRRREAAKLYTSIFPNSKIVKVTRYGSAGPRPRARS